MTAQSKRGRPRLPDNEQAIIFKFRIKPEQLERLRAAAAAAGLPMSAIVAAAVDEKLDKGVTNDNDSAETTREI